MLAYLRRLHLMAGVVAFATFCLSGEYMLVVEVDAMEDAPRMFYRAIHIYLLWSSLLNIALGTYFTKLCKGILERAQALTSAVVILAPGALALSFFYESYVPGLVRPIGSWTVIIASVAVGLQCLVMEFARWQGHLEGSDADARSERRSADSPGPAST
ncbi:hypothetical protein ASD77_17500 [Pseudoxanthomonas sp. Root65]|uniref:hypothetical protein n=1 Tax=Pseudoxanthomonas sp. Root65 TaxID=1736576 RepID=UPI0006FC4357|nr:hypothetical protein [Pseudoxanthomonas sp. Root65]KRA50668.1 hypothetical protein ASD77_17500 [Pseudoxanthomonas sp. Root65]